MPVVARQLFPAEPELEAVDTYVSMLARATMNAPRLFDPGRHAGNFARHHRARPRAALKGGVAMRDETRMLLESVGRLFEDHCTKDVADKAEAGTFPDTLWRAVSETGIPLAALPESAGGADAEWSDLFAVLRVAGRFAAPIPLAETMLAAWVASSAGLGCQRTAR